MTSKVLTHRDYSVGWVCALTMELSAATVMLDERHPDLPKRPSDQNAYTLGSIGDHNIVVACLPKGDIGNNPAATVATRMTTTFPSIRFWLMVGIGGGVPPKVRLGDVVVSTPVYGYPGVVQWDMGKVQDEGFMRTGALDKPPEVLRSAISKLEADRDISGSDTGILHVLKELRSRHQSFASKYLRSESLEDNLFQSDYNHVDQSKKAVDEEEQEEEEDIASSCRHCDRAMIVKRKPRRTTMEIHYGVVASGNSVIKNAKERDEINQQRVGGHALCFEMEAAGIANSYPCLVIRGICGKISSTLSAALTLIRLNRLCGHP